MAVYPQPEDNEPLSARAVVASVRLPLSTLPSTPPMSMEALSAPREVGARRWKVAMVGAIGLVLCGAVAQSQASARIEREAARLLDPIAPTAARLAFENAGAGNILFLTGCPDEMGLVEHAGPHGENVCVDRWEGTLVVVTLDGSEAPWSPYEAIPPGTPIKAVSKPNVVPQGYISQKQAEEACEVAGKRLCSSQEWVSACEGPDATLYPYGEQEDPNACNTHGQSPLRRVFGSLRHAVFGLLPMNNPVLNKLPGTVAKTGSFEKCTNEYGLHDMVGNLHEWTADDDGATGVFRGGYYLDTKVNGRGCGYATTAHGTWYHDYSTGFRCCKDAE